MPRRWATAVVLVAAGGLAAAPVREADPLLVGTRWTGTLTQKGTFGGGGPGPPKFDTVFTVTRRDGAEFEADLRERTADLDITYIVRGEVVRAADGKGYTLSFRSVDAKDMVNTVPILGVPYTGTVAGRTLKGKWVHRRPAEGTEVEGEFALERAK
ncbi:MAG: hypothetical protein K2X82_01205 [Gemmataceae bacterium]|nr:hypothetical protein [Gemmataceae bacterium]